MIKTVISDPTTNAQTTINTDDVENALVVANRPLKIYDNALRYFVNDDYGENINQDVTVSGTPEEVHNGIDDILWTATDIIGGGKTTFNSTDRAYEGTQSVKVDNAPVGDTFQFTKGSALDCTGYITLSMWINVDKDWKINDDIVIYGWDTTTGTQIGDRVGLQDYFNYSDYDVWHFVNIPLTNFGILSESSIDSLRITSVVNDGKGAKFYIDKLQFEEAGTPILYNLPINKEEWLYIHNLQFIMVDEYDSTLLNSTMPSIPYNSLLGVTKLVSGLLLTVTKDKKTIFTKQIQQFLDIMEISKATITGTGTDGTNTWLVVNVEFTEPILLKEHEGDKITITVNDDLTGLIVFKINAGCKIEKRLIGNYQRI